MASVTWETITVPIKSNARPRRLLQAKRRIQGFAAEGRFAGEDGALLLREPCHGRVAARQGRSASRPPRLHDRSLPSPRMYLDVPEKNIRQTRQQEGNRRLQGPGAFEPENP
ncbi:hypothetical protein H101_01193 [Trichophyton interdigitale H6]|nr:hypothetical protein H101_01193 [Trichophyton interdigitale H6]